MVVSSTPTAERGLEPADLAARLIAVTAGALYALWCAPGIQLYDTAELATAAFQLGVAHPPGQPTWSMAGKLVQLLPIGSVAFRSNLLSALCGGLSVWLTAALARAWARGPNGSIAAPLAALGLATSGPLVNQATRTEVYTPALALYLGAILLVSRALSAPAAPVRRLVAAGMLAGLAATLHPANGLGAGIVGLGAVILVRPAALKTARVWLYTIGGLLAGSTPLAFIAARCRPGVEPCWESRMDLAGFWRYVSGAAFRHNLQTGERAFTAMRDAAQFALSATGWAAALLVASVIVAGVVRARAHELRARELLALTAALVVPFAFLAVARFHPENPDTQGYMLPAIAALFAAAPSCALALAAPFGRTAATLLATALVVVAAWRGGAMAYRRDRYYLPQDMAVQALAEVLPKALVLSGSDHMFFGLQYGQLVEGDRPDVGVMVVGLATTSRHWQDVARRRPEVELRRLRPAPGVERHAALARAAMASVEGRLPRYVENPLLLPARVRSTGVLFGVDVPQDRSAAAPAVIVRELARGRRQYADGMDRVLRLWRQKRAFEREDHGELEAAVHEILEGLWDDRAKLEPLLAEFEPRLPLSPVLTTPRLSETWVADASSLRASLAQFLDRGGRTDLAMKVLAHDFASGQPEALLTLAELHLRDGRPQEAARIYRAFARAYPAYEGYALVGLARVQAGRGDRAGALRALSRIDGSADDMLETYRAETLRLLSGR